MIDPDFKQPFPDVIIYKADPERAKKRYLATLNKAQYQLERAQQAVDNISREYEPTLQELIKNLNYHYRVFSKSPDNATARAAFKQDILTIKSNAGMLGYDLASTIAGHFFELFDDPLFEHITNRTMMSIALYIRTLEIIVSRKINNPDAPSIQALFKELDILNIRLREEAEERQKRKKNAAN